MGNCFVTKLKERVNNDNLQVLGELKLKLSGTTKSVKLIAPGAVASISDDYPSVVFTNNNQRTFEFQDVQVDLEVSADCVVYINSKYAITKIQNSASNTKLELDINGIKYCPVTYLRVYSNIDGSGEDIVGNTSQLPNTLTTLIIQSKGVHFDGLPTMPLLTDYTLVADEQIDINYIANQIQFPALQNVEGYYSDFKGTIDTLPVNTVIRKMIITSRGALFEQNVSGNISHFGGWIALTHLDVSGSVKIIGTLESVADAQKDSRSNGATIVFTGNGKVTYNGTAIAKGATKTITFDGQGGYTVS